MLQCRHKGRVNLKKTTKERQGESEEQGDVTCEKGGTARRFGKRKFRFSKYGNMPRQPRQVA